MHLFPEPSGRLRRADWLPSVLVLLASLAAPGLKLRAQTSLIAAVEPAADSVVTNLDVVTVTFSQPVLGVVAEDLILNGTSGTNVTGSGARYAFYFPPSLPGVVQASWNGSHHITDLATNRLDGLGADTVWQYTLVDVVPPIVAAINPAPGSTLGQLTQVAVTFSEPVAGLTAAALLVNGQPATQVTGTGAGPYTFGFPSPLPGPVQLGWAANGGIRDLAAAPNALVGTNWTYTLLPGVFSGDVVINEFLAENSSTNGLRDEDGELQDWIELYNRGSAAVNLGGWSLTDDPAQPDLWVFPAVTLGAGEYLVVFASGKDRRPADGGKLHTNFKLNTPGSYLGLMNANFPREVATQFLPAYPPQRPDIAYGLFGGSFGYLTNATPGAANLGPATFNGIASDVTASVRSGFFNRPFTLSLATLTPGATIRYTLDGSEPTASRGLLYTTPIPVAGTAAQAVVNVRAVACRSDLLSSRVTTFSYIFPELVLQQPANPAGYPASWITQVANPGDIPTVVPADYAMDPRIVTNADYAVLARQALTNLPTLSVVTSAENLFDQTRGIYANPNPPEADRPLWERPASAELILPDGKAGFQINAGLRIHGSTSRDPNWTHKHSLRLFFRSQYDGKLNYPFFADSPVASYHTLVLTAGFNVSWNNQFELAANRAQFVRDQFCSDLQLAMNRAASHGRFVHLYLNGLYWGVYDVHERSDDHFAASYFGGATSQFDVVRNTHGYFEVVAGDDVAWNSMMALVNGNLSDNAQYEQLQQYLDVDSFIDYMIVNHYAGNTDWANHNWYALRRRAPGAGYQFVSWDAEVTLKNVSENVTGYNQNGSPTAIHSFLKNNAEYRLRFADHVNKHYSPGGVLYVDAANPAIDPANPQRNRPGALYTKRIREVDPAIVLESARWGDSRPDRVGNPLTRNVDFLPELNWLTTSYFPQRSAAVLDQYRMQLLYPGFAGLPAPVFSQPSGNVPCGANLTLAAPSGTIYYTTNGTDPRVYGTGTVAPAAVAFTGAALQLDHSLSFKARAFNGTDWSPLSEATYSVAQLLLPLRITEMMFQPNGGQAYQFVELKNLGATALDLSGCAVSGVGFTFPVGFTIAPGAVIVLASGSNPTAFAARYPGVNVAAYFSGKLAKSGETVAIKDALGQTVVAVHYSLTNGWPVASNGASIEIIDPAGNPDDPANWRLSASPNGTPGTLSPPPAPAVRFNELLAVNTGSLSNGGTTPPWVELVNSGSSAVSLAGWSLTDDSNPRKFVFPAGTTLAAGGYVVAFCDSQVAAPGLHTGFALKRQGGNLFLYDAQTNRIDAVGYGMQLADLSLGLVAGLWQLTTPTPGGSNQLAVVGDPASLSVNEWLASSGPGLSDWLELYNASSLPVRLQGLYLGTSNALFQIGAAAFIAPHGYVQLLADEQPGPNHVDFKLPAEGGTIALFDAFGAELNRVNYGPQSLEVSEGRLPDGSANIFNFPGSASPGAPNFVVSFAGPRINEIMARNGGAVTDPFGANAAWIELYNPGASAADLSGMSLSLDQSVPGQWVFPAGATIPAGGYLVLWCDPSRDASTNFGPGLNLGRAPGAQSGGVYLFNALGQTVDYVEYGQQIRNQSIGRNGDRWCLLATPTPGTANALPATLGRSANLRFNEWMAQPLSGADWFELYNLDAQPVDLGGLYLTGDPSLAGMTQFAIAPLSYTAGHGWTLWNADGTPSQGRDHVKFKLAAQGESLRLYAPDLSLLDAVDLGPQSPGISQGRLPDGGDRIVSFDTSPTPGEANYLPLTAAGINEVLTHTDPPLEDAIELVNFTGAPLDLSGWYLSDSQAEPMKFRIPDGTVLPPNGFHVFYEYQFNPTPGTFPSFALDSAHGDVVCLSQADAAGNLTGYRTTVSFGAAENGVSFGRCTNTTGVEFVALSQRTFGVDAPATLADFRTGSGLPNSGPKVGPVVINEIMYHPVTSLGTNLVENPDEEFVELYNLSTDTVPLYDPANPTNTWQLAGGIAFAFPSGAVLAPQSFLVVVDFDPVVNPAALATFRARFGVDATTLIFGPFRGRLSDVGEALELNKPDRPQGPGFDQGFIPRIRVDRVNYGITAPWPEAAAGGGASLQRRSATAFGDDPLNWKAESPTAGRANEPIGASPPVITAQPQGRTVAAGVNVTLSVSASGTLPLSYQWQFDGVDLPGATNATLTLTNAQPADSGSYQVWVSNATGRISSQPTTLSVFAPPAILVQPQGLSATLGGRVTFRVDVAGTPPFYYQWYFNGGCLPGATNASLTLAGVDPAEAGTYQVQVTNNAGGVISYPASLTVSGLDTDGDGMPDSWEIAHGLNPNDPSDANLDPDHDGMTNLQEYLAGTDPQDPRSCLKLDAQFAPEGGGRPQFSFTAIAGIGYTVLYADSLTAPGWQKLYNVPSDPATRAVVVNDPGTNAPAQRFYRIVTPAQP